MREGNNTGDEDGNRKEKGKGHQLRERERDCKKIRKFERASEKQRVYETEETKRERERALETQTKRGRNRRKTRERERERKRGGSTDGHRKSH